MTSRNVNTRASTRSRVLLLVLALSLVPACSGVSEGRETVYVAAAASLTDAFTEIAEVFEQTHPEVDVVLNFAGSSTLREQILEGAPVDVFASADTSNMDQVVAVEGAVDPVIFARNLLQIAVPLGNPAGVDGLEDFAEDDLLIGLCAEPVPCGALAREALANAGVVPVIDTNEPDVRSLLTKIGAGELDAGITYVTDVAAAGAPVEGVEIPDESNVEAEYPIAVVSKDNPPDAGGFVDFVLSGEGQSTLREYGFIAP